MRGSGPDHLFARGHRLMLGAQAAAAEPLLVRAAEALRAGPSASGLIRERVLVSLAYVRAELGHVDEGIALLDEITAEPPLSGIVAGQRGLLLMRSGRAEEAVGPLDEAVRLLDEGLYERIQQQLNRGLLRLTRGELEPARSDFLTCVTLAERQDRPLLRLQARHNLGLISYLSGNLPQALRELDEVAEQLRDRPEFAYVIRVDRARVLYSAGLLEDADEELVRAIEDIGRGGRRQDLAEIDLTRAQVALAGGRAVQARRLARSAARRFARRGSRGWAVLAELTAIRAGLWIGDRRVADPDRVRELADHLQADGFAEDAAMARIVLVHCLLATGRTVPAGQETTSALRLRRGDQIVVRLARREVRAAFAEATGDRGRAASERRAGLDELHRYQASFGSLDLQTAVAVHGRPLAAGGLDAALAAGRPAGVFAWAERTRALASRLPPVQPPEDPDAARALSRLRALRQELVAAQRSGADVPELRRETAELELLVRKRSWYLPGPGDVARPAGLGQAQAALEPGGTLVVHMVSGGAVHALVVTSRRSRLVRLGAAAPILERLKRVRGDLDALAVTGFPAAFRATVRSSLDAGLDALDADLWRPLIRTGGSGRNPAAGDGPVVLVPAGAFTAVPWTMLAGLRGRPVSVARSVTAWLAGRRGAVAGDGPGGVVAVSGPGLPRAEAEAGAVAALWPGARGLTGDRATGAAVLGALGGNRVVHVAAHGTHEVANPLFSSLLLADGPLFGYDVAVVPAAADHVVLSSCDLGRVTERPGDEVLGMTAALLRAGTASVLSSVARVGDEQAHDLTLAYHARLRRGEAPAVALAAVTQQQPAPFVCFGRAW